MSTTIAAPNRPRPTVNMPATPPVRNAIRIAGRSPPSRAAAATRTLPRVHSVIPTNPVSAENSAPTRKKMLPHQRAGHAQGEQRDDGDYDDPGQVGAAHADRVHRQRRDMPEHSTSWKTERKTVPIGIKRVAGSLRTRGPNH